MHVFGNQPFQTDPENPSGFLFRNLLMKILAHEILRISVQFSLQAPLLKKKKFTLLPVTLFPSAKPGLWALTGFLLVVFLGFVRLVGDNGPCSGRVEVRPGEDWTPVSDGNFTLRTAQVICAELGCGKAVSVLGHELFRESDGLVWAEEFRCEGEERKLWWCPRVPCPGGTCHHSGAAQVICSGEMQVRTNLPAHFVQVRSHEIFSEFLSSSTSVLRSPTHDEWLLSVWGPSGDKHFRTMESALCLPLESGQCQCRLSSARLWSRHLYPQRTTLGGERWPDFNSPISLLGGRVLPVEMPCDCLGWSWLFPWQHGLCDLFR